MRDEKELENEESCPCEILSRRGRLEKVHKECWCEPIARKKTLAAALCTDWRTDTAFFENSE